MDQFKKFIESLELVRPGEISSIGLVVNKSGKRIIWGNLPFKIEKIEINETVDYLEILKQQVKALKAGYWMVVNLKAVLPAEVFAQLKQLSLNNRLQINVKDKFGDLKQSDKSRIIVVGSPEIIKENEKAFAGFKNLFGPVIII